MPAGQSITHTLFPYPPPTVGNQLEDTFLRNSPPNPSPRIRYIHLTLCRMLRGIYKSSGLSSNFDIS